MDFKDLLERSWKIFTKFLPALLINTLVLLVVSVFTLGILAPYTIKSFLKTFCGFFKIQHIDVEMIDGEFHGRRSPRLK